MVAAAKTREMKALPEAGLSRLILEMQKLPVSGAVMMVGAHPDDEDEGFLAYCSKGLHLNTYYLVATYGEGGQNEIGPELYAALGVLRSQELASARAIDGATQLYLGATDFGFSKTGTEALAIWGHEEVLRRMVWMFRTYRPDIVFSHHGPTGIATDHGQHQAIGTLLVEAFAAAADPTKFPEQMAQEELLPWQVKKLYISGSMAGSPPVVKVDKGERHPVLGLSYAAIGSLAAAMHKSQGFGGGTSLPKNSSLVHMKLAKYALGRRPATEVSFTEGADFSLHELLDGVDDDSPALLEIGRKIIELDAAIAEILAAFAPLNPASAVGDTLKGLELVRELQDMVARFPLAPVSKNRIVPRLFAKEEDFLQALRDLGVTALDVVAADTDVIPGQMFIVTTSFQNRGVLPVENVRLSLDLPGGWVAIAGGPTITSRVGCNSKAQAKFRVTVPPSASFTGPFDPAPVKVKASWRFAGTGPQLSTVTGAEVRVVPAITVSLAPDKVMAPVSGSDISRDIAVKLTSYVKGAVKGQVVLTVPEGWTVAGDPAYVLRTKGQAMTVALKLTVPAGTAAGSYLIAATATYDGGSSHTSVQAVAYPHINIKYLLKPTEGKVGVIDVKVAPDLKVGYVDGGFDKVPDALRQMGVDVTLLSPTDLVSGDLSKYETIIVGIRAYLSRPELAANNSRLLDYVKNGGNLVVQYHKTDEIKSDQAPFPIAVSPNRVTVESAPVTVLQPDHVLFNAPNKIAAADWDGWLQERGLYFPSKWDMRYTPLVAMNDPGEHIPAGAWLLAEVGKGTYIYTALAWYRQLDGLVPGGYRMFANLISLPKIKTK